MQPRERGEFAFLTYLSGVDEALKNISEDLRGTLRDQRKKEQQIGKLFTTKKKQEGANSHFRANCRRIILID